MLRTDAARKRPSRRPRRGGSRDLFAAIDLGTNNCRLLVAQASGDRFRVVDSYSRIVRLGEGLQASGEISEDAVLRTIRALQDCQKRLKRHRVGKVRCVATQACRVAGNGRSVINRIRDETGLAFKIISPNEEARLAVIGSLDLIDDAAELVLVVDIGGGSTELSWVDARQAREGGVSGALKAPPLLAWASFPIGVVTLGEAFPEAGNPAFYAQMLEDAAARIEAFAPGRAFRDAFAGRTCHLIGTSGTVTSLSAVAQGLTSYSRDRVDGSWLDRDQAIAISARLRAQSPKERAGEPCIGAERADLVLAGCAILEAVWSLWPAQTLRVADRGLREGLLLSMMHKPATSRAGRRGRDNPRESEHDGE